MLHVDVKRSAVEDQWSEVEFSELEVMLLERFRIGNYIGGNYHRMCIGRSHA
jgi:hypothetical protein